MLTGAGLHIFSRPHCQGVGTSSPPPSQSALPAFAGVTQCQPEDIHGEFKPSNRNELLPKSPPFHAKGRRSTDPITNARCKGTDGSGNGSGRLHVYIPKGYFNPSLSPSTKQYSVQRTDKGKPFS